MHYLGEDGDAPKPEKKYETYHPLYRLREDAHRYGNLTLEEEQAYGEKSYPYYCLQDEKDFLSRELALRNRLSSSSSQVPALTLSHRKAFLGTLQKFINLRLAQIEEKEKDLILSQEKLKGRPSASEKEGHTQKQKDLKNRLRYYADETAALRQELSQIQEKGTLDPDLNDRRSADILIIQKQLEKDMAPLKNEAIAARNALVESKIRILFKKAHKLRGKLDRLTAFSEGAFGLIRAAEKYDPRRNRHFMVYADWWIFHDIQVAQSKNADTIVVFHRLIKMKEAVEDAERTFQTLFKTSPTDEELGAWMELQQKSFPSKDRKKEEEGHTFNEMEEDQETGEDEITPENPSEVSADQPSIPSPDTSLSFEELRKILEERQNATGKRKKRIEEEQAKVHFFRFYYDQFVSLESMLEVEDEAMASTLSQFATKEETNDFDDPTLQIIVAHERRKMIFLLFEKARLNSFEQKIIIERFGLDEEDYDNDKILKDIGKSYSLGHERIRQIEKEALRKISAVVKVDQRLAAELEDLA